jgi:hypothetical protein
MAGERTDLADIREARRLVERMRDRLLHPSFEALEYSAADLRLAAQCLQRLDIKSPVWQGVQRKALESEVTGLRRAVDCVEALLKNAGKFYAGWARLMSGDQGPPNYSSAGSTDPAPAQSNKLVMHG